MYWMPGSGRKQTARHTHTHTHTKGENKAKQKCCIETCGEGEKDGPFKYIDRSRIYVELNMPFNEEETKKKGRMRL